jgi:hypothetical protein
MNSTQPTPGERLIHTISRRMIEQSERRQKLRGEANSAIARFAGSRDEAHEKLMAKLAVLKVSEVPRTGLKLPWSGQKEANKRLLKSHQKLVSVLEQILKEHQKAHRETARLLKGILACLDDAAPEHDSV